MNAYDAGRFRGVFENHFTYIAGWRRNVHRYAGNVALRDPESGRSWTYAELGDVVERLARGLLDAGVRTGDVVSYQLYNQPEFAFLYLATQRIGAVGSPVNFRLAPGETAFILDRNRPVVFVYDKRLAETARRALELASYAPPTVLDTAAFDQLLTSDAPVSEPATTTWDETTRLFTSGTTGMPKGVPLPGIVEVLSAHDVIMHFPLTPHDRTLNMTPWFHRGGLYSGGPNPVFYVGAEAVAMRAFDAGTCLDHVQEYGITFLIGAPTSLAMLADAQQNTPRDLSTLHGIVTMGAPLERAACLRYQEVLTARIFNGYGTTEAFWNTFLRPTDLPDHAGTAGRSCTDDDVAVVHVYPDRLADPTDTVARDGSEVGEVIVRSPKCGYAYTAAPEEEAARFHDGWLYIGDLGTWDAQEYVTIVGRKDDMIISGGENVHPVQVEEVLALHPGVSDAVVVGSRTRAGANSSWRTSCGAIRR